jgi:hypothetical protein
MAQVLFKALHEAGGEFVVSAGEIEKAVQVLTKMVVEPGDDDAA